MLGNRQPVSDGDRPVTRYELDLIRQSIAKDSEIAALKAQIYATDAVNGVRRELCDFEKQQAVYDGVNNAMVKFLQEQTDQLRSMTRVVIPDQNIMGFVPGVTAPASPSTASQNSGSSSTNTQG